MARRPKPPDRMAQRLKSACAANGDQNGGVRAMTVGFRGFGELEPVGMLLCLSSRRGRVFEEPVEVSGEVAFEAAGGLAAAFPFLGSAFDVVDGRSVRAASSNDDLVECSVELSVAAAVEPVADRLA